MPRKKPVTIMVTRGTCAALGKPVVHKIDPFGPTIIGDGEGGWTTLDGGVAQMTLAGIAGEVGINIPLHDNENKTRLKHVLHGISSTLQAMRKVDKL